MLILPKWQKMWMESQHCSKSIASAPLSSQQAKKVLEDLRTHCCSPIKAVQLEALKCWEVWIQSQEPEDWKQKTICFAAVRPLVPNKLQPLHKDVDICTLKLSLMWALIVKVQNIIHLEGPQYILEVFLQYCLTWLPSADDDDERNSYVSGIIIQLLLRLFKKDEVLTGIENDKFPPLTADVLHSKKTFRRLAEKFIKVFVHWRKVREKTVILKLWKHFLEHCELSCEHIPVPIWHKIFKQAGQILSEKEEPVKERLAFLHACATTLKSALASSKFIDCGNLLTTPCEALLKNLVELCCTVESEGCSDSEVFYHSKEICQVLSVKNVALGGYVVCINVLDILDEFWLRDLFWGTWCGLVGCYKILLQDIGQNEFTKIQMKFYRKLRGVAVNFELDRNNIHKDCINEVEEHIRVLNIGCLCAFHALKNTKDSTREAGSVELMDTDSHSQPSESPPVTETAPEEVYKQIVQCEPMRFYGKFSDIVARKRLTSRYTVNLNFDLIEDILKKVDTVFLKSSLNYSFSFLFVKLQRTATEEEFRLPTSRSLQFRTALGAEQEMISNVPCAAGKTPSPVPECVPPLQETEEEEEDEDDETISTPLTRSRRRAEEERERELERQTRRKRKSFEDIVQEILKKNKERKTEKNSKKKSSVSHKGKRNKKKVRKDDEDYDPKPPKNPCRQLRNSKKEEPKKEKQSKKTDGKLENYFKVLSKKSEKEMEKEENKSQKKKKKKKKKEKPRESSCCKPEKEEGEKKGEIGWRQTSLKTMMSQKSQGKPRVRKSKMTACPLVKLSPFKEVLHDHEYVKIDPQRLQESVLFTRQERKVEKSQAEDKKQPKTELNKPQVPETAVKECEELDVVESETPEQPKTEPIGETEVPNLQEECETLQADEVIKDGDVRVKLEEENPSVEVGIETLVRRGIKRMRTCDDSEPNKRIKLEREDQQEEKFFSEVAEKENLEDRQSPREKVSNCSALNTMSRALRMIALVPESTKGGQIQREALPRVEALKSKKGPNVDRSSRASKMLALLSENVVEVEDVSDIKADDVSSWGAVASTPNAKTPTSSLKSPKSVKKRRSIRFDDAKNETVLYQTDTPPSQILEEKEKSRRSKLAEVMVNCH